MGKGIFLDVPSCLKPFCTTPTSGWCRTLPPSVCTACHSKLLKENLLTALEERSMLPGRNYDGLNAG